MANLRPAETAPLSRLITKLHVTSAGTSRIRALVDGWREGRDTAPEIRRILVEAAKWSAGPCPEDHRESERWCRNFDSTCDEIDRVLIGLSKREVA